MSESKESTREKNEESPYSQSEGLELLYDWTRKIPANRHLYVSGPNARHFRAAIKRFFKSNWPDGSHTPTFHKEQGNWQLHIKTFETVEVMYAIYPDLDECDITKGYRWELYHKELGLLTCEPWPFVRKETKEDVKLSEYIAAKIAEQLRALKATPNLMNAYSIAKEIKIKSIYPLTLGGDRHIWIPSREFISLHLAKVKDLVKEEPIEETPESAAEGWQALQDLLFEQTDKSADALSMVRYYVPVIKKLSFRKLIARYALEINRTTLYDNIDCQFVKLSPTAKGNAAELYIVRQLETMGVSCTWGGGRKSVSDVSGKGWSVAVKVAFREPYEIHTEPMTPEHKADLALCVFIRPRVHRVRIFPITSSKMVLSGDEGSSCGIGEIGARLKELISNVVIE